MHLYGVIGLSCGLWKHIQTVRRCVHSVDWGLPAGTDVSTDMLKVRTHTLYLHNYFTFNPDCSLDSTRPPSQLSSQKRTEGI